MRKSISLIMCMACMACLLTACKVENNNNKDIGEIDSSANHINLSIGENVTIDADITPKADYAEGLAVYKGCWWSEDYSGFDAFSESPAFWGKSIADIVSLMAEYGVGSFTEDTLQDMKVWHGEESDAPRVTVTDTDGNDLRLFATLMEGDSSKIQQPKCLYPFPSDYPSIRLSAENSCDLDEYMDSDLAGTQIDIDSGRQLLEELTDIAFSDHYLCLPLEELGEDVYAVYFFPDVDGFPTYKEPLAVEYDEGADLGEYVLERQYIEDHVAGVSNLWFNPQYIFYKGGKIIGLDIEPSVYVGDLYREKTPVAGAEEIVGQIRNYFEKNYISDPITITDITLAYNGYVNDGSNGKKVEHTVSPFWYVMYCDEENGERKSRCLLFDAFSGEFVAEQGFLMY